MNNIKIFVSIQRGHFPDVYYIVDQVSSWWRGDLIQSPRKFAGKSCYYYLFKPITVQEAARARPLSQLLEEGPMYDLICRYSWRFVSPLERDKLIAMPYQSIFDSTGGVRSATWPVNDKLI